MRRFAPLIAIALCVACDPTRPADPFDVGDFTSVHAMLVAGENEARVLITRVQRPLLPFLESESARVAGARVVLRHGNAAWNLTTTAADTLDRCTIARHSLAQGCYFATIDGGILPGGRYTLDIELPDGGKVTGETVVPEPPAIVVPTTKPTFLTVRTGTSTEDRTPVEVRWTGADPDEYFVLSARTDRPDCTVAMNGDDPFSVAGTDQLPVTGNRIMLKVVNVQCLEPIEVPRWEATLRVTRFGDEFARRRAAASAGTADPDSLSFGITGAIGIFTGAASATLPATIITP